jgi:hypothetical protein
VAHDRVLEMADCARIWILSLVSVVLACKSARIIVYLRALSVGYMDRGVSSCQATSRFRLTVPAVRCQPSLAPFDGPLFVAVVYTPFVAGDPSHGGLLRTATGYRALGRARGGDARPSPKPASESGGREICCSLGQHR